MNIADRLKSFLDQKGINNRDADHRFGFSNGLTGKFLTGKTTLGIDKIEAILKAFPELNADWLVRGRGPMYISPYPNQDEEDQSNALEEPFVPYGPDYVDAVLRWREQVSELLLRLHDKDETISALKEAVQVYREMVKK